MKRMIMVGLLLIVVGAFATDRAEIVGQGGIHFLVGLPQDEFGENVGNAGIGFGLGFGVMPNSFFSVGGVVGFMNYGSETRREPLSYTIPDVTVEVTRSNNFLQGQIYMQAIADMDIVKPYIEGRVGFNYLWTETRVSDIDGDDEDIASSTNFDDFTLNYGGGGGLMIKVYEKSASSRDESDRSSRVYVDLKVIYTKGGNAEYLKEGSMEIIDNQVVYHPDESHTDLLGINVGVEVEF